MQFKLFYIFQFCIMFFLNFIRLYVKGVHLGKAKKKVGTPGSTCYACQSIKQVYLLSVSFWLHNQTAA